MTSMETKQQSLMSHLPSDIPWKESRFHSQKNQQRQRLQEDVNENKNENGGNDGDDDGDDDDNDDDDDDNDEKDSFGLDILFADPDPMEIFSFDFSSSIKIRLQGQKKENGQLLHSTGLTLWRASELLCQYLLEHSEVVRNKCVVELGAGMGLCGILAHKLGADYVYITDGDVDTLANLRRNVVMNDCEQSKVSCPQLIWGNTTQYPQLGLGKVEVDYYYVVMAADVVYTIEMLDPLWKTVSSILTDTNNKRRMGHFVLSYSRRNVSINLVLEYATNYGFEWMIPSVVGTEGIYIFSKKMGPP